MQRRPRRINHGGTVTGSTKTGNGVTHGFMCTKKLEHSPALICPHNPAQTAGWTINTAGVIAGLYTDAGGGVHGLSRATDATITTFTPPGVLGTIVPGGFDTGHQRSRECGWLLSRLRQPAINWVSVRAVRQDE